MKAQNEAPSAFRSRVNCVEAVFGLVAVLFFIAALRVPHRGVRAQVHVERRDGVPALDTPDAACAGCHRTIYDSYEKTPMARGSGLAMDGLIAGSFQHTASGLHYAVYEHEGRAWMSYERTPGEALRDGQGAVSGQRSLAYFIGSGKRGRTYLYQVDGQWFELPINFYSKRGVWDMAPAFDNAKTMPTALPVDPNCLHCHATEVSAAEPQARSRYAAAPFRQGGVGCSSCHGDATHHVASGGHAPITNPDKLSSVRRDSACLQCHLEGDAVVYRPGRSLAKFVAGEDLSDYALYFVRESSRDGGRRAASQYEALLRSACKAGSGDRLTCTTCHDPHSSPASAERVSYFRQRCLSCHTGAAMAKDHHPEQPDCAACHMPTRPTSDISHEQLTDHNIQRHPAYGGAQLRSLAEQDDLVTVGGVPAGKREQGLAYAQLAEHGDQVAGEKAMALLGAAERENRADTPVHVQLGFLDQVSGHRSQARSEYQQALAADAYNSAALGNLAVLEAIDGHSGESVRLLERLFQSDPSQIAGGLNLAFLECRLGAPQRASAVLEGLRVLNPDDPQLRAFLQLGTYAGQRCTIPTSQAAPHDISR